MAPESLMMSHGYRPELSEGALKVPIFQTSTFVFRSAEEGKAHFELAYGLRKRRPRESPGLIYSRLNNPDMEVLEDRLSLWDGAEACAVFSSGMSAIVTTLYEFLRPGDVVLYSEPLYGGTDHFFKHVLTRFDIQPVGFSASGGAAAAERAFKALGRGARLGMLFLETPANPTNMLVDIAACAALAGRLSPRGRRALTVVDNTFLGPLWQHPLEHGADLVLYSATKYIGGHSDVIAGACLGPKELVDRVRAMRTFSGTMMSPLTGWLLMRSLETLKLRMTCQMKNARYVADFLAEHPKVERVHYLGHLREGSEQQAIYARQCLSPGSIVSFDIEGGEREAFRFLDALRLFKLAVSLGGTESLAEHPSTMTHADVPTSQKRRCGVGPGMVRLSIGVENPDDLMRDLDQALAAA